MDKDSSAEQKTWQVYNFGKRSVFRFHLMSPERVSVARFPGSLQVLTSTYKLNLPSKVLQVLTFASQSLQV